MKRLVLGLLLALAPLTAEAYEGTYLGERHEVVVRRIQGDRFQVDVQAFQRGCGGQVRMIATITSRSTIARALNQTDERYRFCDVLLTFQGRQLQIEEGHGCLEWHGVACRFTGTLTVSD